MSYMFNKIDFFGFKDHFSKVGFRNKHYLIIHDLTLDGLEGSNPTLEQ